MSIAALRWAFRLQGLRPATKAVLVALADHASTDGTCYPSLATMAQWTALTERAVRGALRDLEAAGHIQTKQECGRNSHYSLACFGPATPEGNAGGTPEPAAGVGDETPEGNAGVVIADPGTSCPPPRNLLPGTPEPPAPEPLETPKKPPTLSLTEKNSGFEKFWDAYPRKVGKGAARRAWKGAMAKAPEAVIIAACAGYPFNRAEPQYIPHPATWLNQERWADDLRLSPQPISALAPSTSPLDRVRAAIGAGRPPSLVRVFLAHDPDALALYEQQQRSGEVVH